MIITRITPSKSRKDFYSIYADDKFLFSLSAENVFKFGLKEGLDLGRDRLAELILEEQTKIGLDFALKLLAFRSRSEKELRGRILQKNFSEEIANRVIGKLKRMKFVDDERFANEYAASLKQKQKGPRFIRAELARKGVERETIDEIAGGLYPSPEDEIEQIKEIAEKKLAKMKNVEPEKAAQRLMRFLFARGFSIDNINSALRKLRSEEDER
jgi:regulatory protein